LHSPVDDLDPDEPDALRPERRAPCAASRAGSPHRVLTRSRARASPLAITTTLPSLAGAAPAPVRSQWSALASALADHEHEHRAIALACRGELARRLAGVRGADDCDALRRALDAAGRSAVAECRARADHFDRDTRHGASGR
jgi:predicted secreted Zn-dependent protease